MLRICYRLVVGALLLASAGVAEQRVSSDYRDYVVRLTPWRTLNGRTSGALVQVRINNGKTLRLLLDTGASGITLDERTARKQPMLDVADTEVSGVGAAARARLMLASRVQIGELEVADCPVRVMARLATPEADGVIGMDVFQEFRIRLDAGARELRLEAFGERPVRTVDSDPLLFVRARINGKDEGMFLVDTGSAVTTLASDVQWPAMPFHGEMALRGAGGEVAGTRLAPVSLQVGDWKVLEREPVAVDLTRVSRINGVKVAGILGYSVLSRGPVVFNYRDRLVELGSR
jgi:predicted aspartyl protease